MSPAQRAVAARMAQRRAARAERLDGFDAAAFGPDTGDRAIERPRPQPPGDLRRLWRWGRAHEWPAQIVLGLMAVTVCYLALVFGLLIGAGIAGL